VKVFWLDQDALIQEISHIASKLGEADENISKIILFGSLADRKAVPGSDADILVMLKKDERNFMDRLSEWQGKFPIDFPTDVFPYTKEELNNPIVLQATRKGLTLFERDR
jgi:predicted nucleotidyltransferase